MLTDDQILDKFTEFMVSVEVLSTLLELAFMTYLTPEICPLCKRATFAVFSDAAIHWERIKHESADNLSSSDKNRARPFLGTPRLAKSVTDRTSAAFSEILKNVRGALKSVHSEGDGELAFLKETIAFPVEKTWTLN